MTTRRRVDVGDLVRVIAAPRQIDHVLGKRGTVVEADGSGIVSVAIDGHVHWLGIGNLEVVSVVDQLGELAEDDEEERQR